MNETQDLSDFVRNQMIEKNISTYDIQRASGNTVSAGTVTKIVNRDVRSNSIETLVGLAKGLGVPADDVIRIARGLSTQRASRFEIYAETFDAHDLSDSEWEMLETYFNDHVKTWQKFQKERTQSPPKQRPLAPVVARIEPGNATKADVQRMIDADNISEIERRLKKKAS